MIARAGHQAALAPGSEWVWSSGTVSTLWVSSPGAVVNFRLLREQISHPLRAAREAGPAIPSRSIHVMN